MGCTNSGLRLGGEKTGLFRPVRNRMLPGAEDLPPQQKDYLSCRQAIPGSSRPSRNSREAPPPVEM